jgi:hypothetical protein
MRSPTKLSVSAYISLTTMLESTSRTFLKPSRIIASASGDCEAADKCKQTINKAVQNLLKQLTIFDLKAQSYKIRLKINNSHARGAKKGKSFFETLIARRRKAESRKQKAEGRKQKAESGRQMNYELPADDVLSQSQSLCG